MTNRIRTAMARRDQGFTLIELLVVIIIIGILAAVAIPVFLNQRKKGVDAGIKSDLKNAASAAETFATDNAASTDAYTNDGINQSGFKKTPGNTIHIAGSPSAGFCVRGYNSGGTADSTTNAFWYDSRAGGLKSGGAGGAPDGGVCAGATGWAELLGSSTPIPAPSPSPTGAN